MMRIEANKVLVSTTKFLVGATKFLVSVTKFLVNTTKIHRADQKFGCLNPHHFLVGLIKNEGQSDQNFGQPNQIDIWLSQPSQKVGSAYKISMSVNRYLTGHLKLQKFALSEAISEFYQKFYAVATF